MPYIVCNLTMAFGGHSYSAYLYDDGSVAMLWKGKQHVFASAIEAWNYILEN